MSAHGPIVLPVCGLAVRLRLPGGADEMALIEDPAECREAGLRLIARLAEDAAGDTSAWDRLPVTDFEILLLHLRAALLGPVISTTCPCPACGERADISFRVADYIGFVRPRVPPGVRQGQGAQAGWLVLDGAAFRVPSIADQLAVRRSASPGAAMRALCLAPGLPGPVARRIEAAIARMAPEVTGPVGGPCPHCGAAVRALFDVARYVVTELRRIAHGLYEEIHLLASAYGWTEADILALPGPRRRRYAESLRA
jgi:hypothetical protein